MLLLLLFSSAFALHNNPPAAMRANDGSNSLKFSEEESRKSKVSIKLNAGKPAPKIKDEPLAPWTTFEQNSSLTNDSFVSLLESKVKIHPLPRRRVNMQRKEEATEANNLEVMSVYDLFLDVYNHIPNVNWHVRAVAVLLLGLIMVAGTAFLGIILQQWEARRRDLALKEAAQLVCKGPTFNTIDDRKVAAILGDLLEKSENNEGGAEKNQEYSPESDLPASICKTHSSTIPEGTIRWTMHYSDNGAPCFYNHETGEKRWSVPDEIAELAQNSEANFELPSGCNLPDQSESEQDD